MKKIKIRNLEDMFHEQKEFQSLLVDIDSLNSEDKISLTKEYLLSLHKEVSELLDVLNWKSHKSYPDKHLKEREFLIESVDCLKFLINILIIWDITPSQLKESYSEKSLLVRLRLRKEKLTKE